MLIMKFLSEGKTNEDGTIFSNETITEKEGYEAMLYMLYAFWKDTESNDLTDILSGGEYWPVMNRPADSAFWEYWLEAVDKVRREGPPPIKVLRKE